MVVDNDNSHDFDDTSQMYQTAALDPTKQYTLSAKRTTGGFIQHPSPIKTQPRNEYIGGAHSPMKPRGASEMRGQEYDGDMSEFNTSLKMSMVINKPIYEKKDGAGGQLKKNSTLGANTSTNKNMQPSGVLQKENILMRNAKAADIKSSDTRIIDPNQSQENKLMSIDGKQEPSSQVKFVELKRFMFQLENILEFSEDEASDTKDLIKLIEQCLNRSLYLKQENITKELMRDML